MMTLVECWVSRASAKQRRGRAGRVRPGVAFHLFSSLTNDDTMSAYTLPEMLRVRLDDLVMQILLLDLGEPRVFLNKAVDPPSEVAVRNSLTMLQGLAAVELDKGGGDEKETSSYLTALGFHLATLPVEARVGKMLIYGAMFQCLDPCLTIAAILSSRSPFMSPFDKREQADEAKKR